MNLDLGHKVKVQKNLLKEALILTSGEYSGREMEKELRMKNYIKLLILHGGH